MGLEAKCLLSTCAFATVSEHVSLVVRLGLDHSTCVCLLFAVERVSAMAAPGPVAREAHPCWRAECRGTTPMRTIETMSAVPGRIRSEPIHVACPVRAASSAEYLCMAPLPVDCFSVQHLLRVRDTAGFERDIHADLLAHGSCMRVWDACCTPCLLSRPAHVRQLASGRRHFPQQQGLARKPQAELHCGYSAHYMQAAESP